MTVPADERAVSRALLADYSLATYLQKHPGPAKLVVVRPTDKVYEAMARLSRASVMSAPIVDAETQAVSGACVRGAEAHRAARRPSPLLPLPGFFDIVTVCQEFTTSASEELALVRHQIGPDESLGSDLLKEGGGSMGGRFGERLVSSLTRSGDGHFLFSAQVRGGGRVLCPLVSAGAFRQD